MIICLSIIGEYHVINSTIQLTIPLRRPLKIYNFSKVNVLFWLLLLSDFFLNNAVHHHSKQFNFNMTHRQIFSTSRYHTGSSFLSVSLLKSFCSELPRRWQIINNNCWITLVNKIAKKQNDLQYYGKCQFPSNLSDHLLHLLSLRSMECHLTAKVYWYHNYRHISAVWGKITSNNKYW